MEGRKTTDAHKAMRPAADDLKQIREGLQQPGKGHSREKAETLDCAPSGGDSGTQRSAVDSPQPTRGTWLLPLTAISVASLVCCGLLGIQLIRLDSRIARISNELAHSSEGSGSLHAKLEAQISDLASKVTALAADLAKVQQTVGEPSPTGGSVRARLDAIESRLRELENQASAPIKEQESLPKESEKTLAEIAALRNACKQLERELLREMGR
jgi:hypothetical protein